MIKYLIMDVDGTLTDGKIYMGQNGEVMKAFSCKDGYGIHHMLPDAGITPVIITGRTSNIVANRAKEIGINEVHQGISDKLSKLREVVGDDLSVVAYIGDDLNDIDCMYAIKEAGGVIGVPSDSVKKILDCADYVCAKAGGDGAVREFIEWLIEREN